MSVSRPSVSENYLEIAEAVSRRGECVRRRVGAVIVKDQAIVATGFNGAPPGQRSCLDGACPRATAKDVIPGEGYERSRCRVIHAELNAALRADWDRMQGSVMYVTDEPCEMCRPMIEASGISRVVTPSGVWNVR